MSLKDVESVPVGADDGRELPHHLRDLDHLPALLGPSDIAALWRISARQYYRLAKRGVFDFLKVKPVTGPKCFSGVLVARHLRGESVYVPTFGRKRA